MPEIDVGNGLVALVDERDFKMFGRVRWYAVRRKHYVYVRSRLGLLHRVIMNAPAGLDVDHVNGNGLDNRRSNLRLATRQQNLHNSRKPTSGKSSTFKGVSWDESKRRWRARLRTGGRQVFLGLFDRERDAARAYNRAAREAFGAFALVNAAR